MIVAAELVGDQSGLCALAHALDCSNAIYSAHEMISLARIQPYKSSLRQEKLIPCLKKLRIWKAVRPALGVVLLANLRAS